MDRREIPCSFGTALGLEGSLTEARTHEGGCLSMSGLCETASIGMASVNPIPTPAHHGVPSEPERCNFGDADTNRRPAETS